jgi:2-C-methyl-D-erythritol 2,4-cyclodiphosphate synthase
MRIGQGFDVHALVAGRRLVIGGVEIAHDKGLLGHSDADVLLHAICDALLGAAALGDIGRHFPDSDARYKGIDSRELLRHVARLLQDRGFSVSNVDATIIAQAPAHGAAHPEDGREHRGGSRARRGTREREGDDDGDARVHRARRGHRRAGDLPHFTRLK